MINRRMYRVLHKFFLFPKLQAVRFGQRSCILPLKEWSQTITTIRKAPLELLARITAIKAHRNAKQ